MLTALVLGAGLSERMGEEKLLLPLGNQTLLERTLSSIRNGFSGVIVVITKEKIYKAVKKNDSFYYRINKYPEKGQAFSLMLGVREIMKRCPESDG
ncbi:MAG: NTP transferase domain-containing protein, partial [Eubacterium sp.]